MGRDPEPLEEEAALSIGHLLDHVANVYRLTESIGGTYREVQQSYAVVYSALPCTFQRRDTVVSADGPGERAVGDRRIYFDVEEPAGPLFEDRDVIEIVSGPTGFRGPQLLEVESIAVPRGHHIEIRATEFKGDVQPGGGS